MAAGTKRSKVKWDYEDERKIIHIWADILKEFNRKSLTRTKEAIATVRLNEWMNEELNRMKQYAEKTVCNIIDLIMKIGKQMYVAYQKKGEEGVHTGGYRPGHGSCGVGMVQFKMFFTCFKDQQALGWPRCSG